MGKLRTLILSPLLLCSVSLLVQAQTTLQPGTPIERTLGAGQTHEFSVSLEENSFIQLVVEQRGIDVVVKVSSPDGKNLGEYDTPNGNDGPEHVSFVASAAGAYRISISPLDQAAQATGRYEIKVIEIRAATDQELKENKNLEEVRAKGIALLTEIETTIQEIKSPHSRIQAHIKIGELLWEVDEKRAAKSMSNAMAGIKEFLATADVSSDEYMAQYQGISQLRDELIRVMAELDPEAALNFLQSSTPRHSPYSNPRDLLSQETALELSIADKIVQKDPNRAVQIARRSLKTGYSSNLVVTVTQLAQKNPELATELVHEIAGKLLNEDKLIKNPEATALTISLLSSYQIQPDSGQIVMRRMGSPIRSGLLSEDEYRQLLQKAVGEIVSYSQPRLPNTGQDGIWSLIVGLQSLGAEMDKVVTGSKAAIEKKSKELNMHTLINNPTIDLQKLIANNPVEEALENIEKAPSDSREHMYIQLAYREAANGDLARARQIVNDYVTNPFQRRQTLNNLEQQETFRVLGKGKVEEALRNVGTLRTARERATQLSQIVHQIGQGQKRATALNLLEQARALLNPSPQAPDAEHMTALFDIARAFSQYDSKRSFEIVDPLIDQFNELCTAARTMEGFGGEYFEDDELSMKDGNGLANIVSQMSGALGDLALTNFDRAKATTEKIHLPEVRLMVYLEIAQQTIKGDR